MNQSSTDRLIRIMLGGVLLIIVSYFPLNVYLTWILVLLGIFLIVTGLTGFCPAYSLLKLGTKK